MTYEEFENLKVGDKVYHFRYPHSKYIGTWSAAISSGIISHKRILDEGTENASIGFQVKGGGVIFSTQLKFWFIDERSALVYKIKYMKQWIKDNRNKKSIRGYATTSEIEAKFRTIMMSKKVRKLLLETNPELFI